MHQLAEFQRMMASVLLGGQEADLDHQIVGTDDLIDIYKNNFRISLIDVLAKTYPVIRRLVGNDYFRQVTQAFICEEPPRTRSLHSYGEEFPEFLTKDVSAVNHPYLSDVARLEWACNLAYHAADARLFEFEHCRGIPAAAWPSARVHFSPSLQLVHSPFPIAQIWQENQPGEAEPSLIDLDASESFIIVVRPNLEVRLHSHSSTEFQFIRLLKNGSCLELAFDRATANGESFDLMPLLGSWISAGVIIDFSTVEGFRS